MAKLTLYDHSAQQTIPLTIGSKIDIGRGGLLQCNDKRISRKHGEILVSETHITVKSLSTNPIFYQLNSSDYLILTKDSEVSLTHSDRFSLLPNEFEYEIQIVKEESGENASTAELRIRNILEINDNLEAGSIATSLSQIVGHRATAEAEEDLDRTPSPELLIPPTVLLQQTSNLQPDSSSNIAFSTAASRKRSLDGNESDSGEPKKRRSASQDQQNPVSSAIPNVTSTSEIKIKPDPDSTCQSDAKTTAGSSSNATVIKPDPDALQTSSTATIKQENVTNAALRPSCGFGVRCYRNTPEHLRNTAHPSDADYRRPDFPPAPANAAPCPFGSSCYRRNPDHFRELQHPSSNVYTVAPPAPAVVVQNPNNNSDEENDELDEEEGFDDSEADQDFEIDEISNGEEDEDENNLEE